MTQQRNMDESNSSLIKKKIFKLGFLISFIFAGYMFIWGQNGLMQQKKMLQSLHKLQKNQQIILQENRQLQQKIINVENNPQIIKEEAHKLLLMEKDAIMIRFLRPDDQ